LFDNPEIEQKTGRLLDALDTINHEMGRGTIHLASEGCNQSWKVRSEKRTPPYTTNWDALLQVR
jgi:DNA polymerase V